jgi:hypothetical protein
MDPGEGPERLAWVIADISREDDRFHIEGGSWTNSILWVRGYDDVLIPMERASALLHERVLAGATPSSDPGYGNALVHLLSSETSCYRYWGECVSTYYGAELARRATETVAHDL